MRDKKTQMGYIFSAAVFTVFIGGFFILSIFFPHPRVLVSERRFPARFPALSAKTILSAEFMNRFNDYAADNFPFRDSFRSINSQMVLRLYMQSDKSGLYLDEFGIGEFKTIDSESFRELSRKISAIAAPLNEAKVSIYYAYIPDKSIYSSRDLPGFDLLHLGMLMEEQLGMEEFVNIDLSEALSAQSYYSSDLHWNQVMLLPVLEKLGDAMGFLADLSQYNEEYIGEFEGVYTGQLALTKKTDDLNCLFNPSLSAMYLGQLTMEMEEGPVYDPEKLSGLDAYDFFLNGAQPLIVLENPEASSERELYLFRDSFSSSLAPLLGCAYAKIYLIDLRYIDMRTLGRYVQFKPGSDALFLYSSLIINNAEILQVG